MHYSRRNDIQFRFSKTWGRKKSSDPILSLGFDILEQQASVSPDSPGDP